MYIYIYIYIYTYVYIQNNFVEAVLVFGELPTGFKHQKSPSKRLIFDPVKHLKWSFFKRWLTVFSRTTLANFMLDVSQGYSDTSDNTKEKTCCNDILFTKRNIDCNLSRFLPLLNSILSSNRRCRHSSKNPCKTAFKQYLVNRPRCSYDNFLF